MGLHSRSNGGRQPALQGGSPSSQGKGHTQGSQPPRLAGQGQEGAPMLAPFLTQDRTAALQF